MELAKCHALGTNALADSDHEGCGGQERQWDEHLPVCDILQVSMQLHKPGLQESLEQNISFSELAVRKFLCH